MPINLIGCAQFKRGVNKEMRIAFIGFGILAILNLLILRT